MTVANAFGPATGPIAWEPRQSASNPSVMTAMIAAIAAIVVPTPDDALGTFSRGNGVRLAKSASSKPMPLFAGLAFSSEVAAEAEATGAEAGAEAAPGRLIFNVFFCVTVAGSGVLCGRTESGMRDVWWIGAVWESGAGVGAFAEGERSDGRFSLIVFGSLLIPVPTPIAESSEIRDVLDFAAWICAGEDSFGETTEGCTGFGTATVTGFAPAAGAAAGFGAETVRGFGPGMTGFGAATVTGFGAVAGDIVGSSSSPTAPDTVGAVTGSAAGGFGTPGRWIFGTVTVRRRTGEGEAAGAPGAAAGAGAAGVAGATGGFTPTVIGRGAPGGTTLGGT